jgi:hypothetical protein
MLKLIFATAALVGSLLGGSVVNTTQGEMPGTVSITPEYVCPRLYAPVICDDGKVYVNMCYAEKHHAENCVPYFEP